MACNHCGLSHSSLIDLSYMPHSRLHANSDLLSYLHTTDARISCLEDILKRLVLKRRHLMKKINYNSSPLLRLPLDVTSEIFKTYILKEDVQAPGEKFVLGDGVPRTWPGSRSSPVARLFLGSICSAWREVAWSLPWMWTCVSLVWGPSSSPNAADLLDQWLSRSGQGALSIHLKSKTAYGAADDTVLGIIKVVSRSSERWKRVILDLPAPGYHALRSVEGRVPLIESVFVKLQGIPYVVAPLTMFSIAPKLRSAHYERFPMSTIVLSTAQMTILSGSHCGVVPVLEMLKTSPRLIAAHFGVLADDAYHDTQLYPIPEPQPILVPCLDIIAFDFNSHTKEMEILLDNLTLPRLRKFVFAATFPSWNNFVCSNFITFVLRSACPLQCLVIKGFRISDQDLLRCLEVVPSLTQLDISLRGTTNQTIHNLQVTLGEVPLLPNLQNLSIGLFDGCVDLFQLYEFLSARRGVIKPIPGRGRGVAEVTSVKVECVDVLQETYESGYPLLRKLAEGMQISVMNVDTARRWL